MLEAEEVLAGGSAAGDLEGPLGGGLIPLEGGGGVDGGTLLPDLEPAVAGSVPGGNVAGSPGEVGGVWAGVDDLLVNSETDGVTSVDGHGLGGGLSVDVAAESNAADIFDGAVVVLRDPLADVLPLGLDLAANDESVEAVCRGIVSMGRFGSVERGKKTYSEQRPE